MCLDIPAKVIEINKKTLIGKANVGGIKKEAKEILSMSLDIQK